MRRRGSEEVEEILFGNKLQPVNLVELSKVTGISHSTLSDYRRQPGKIPLYRLCMIINARGIAPEEVGKALKAYTGGKRE